MIINTDATPSISQGSPLFGSGIKDLITTIFLQLDAPSLVQCRLVCRQWHQILNREFFLSLLERAQFFFLNKDLFIDQPMAKFVKIFRKISREFSKQNSLLSIEKIFWLQNTSEGKKQVQEKWKKVQQWVSDHQLIVVSKYVFASEAFERFEIIPAVESSLFLGKWANLNEACLLSDEDKPLFYFVTSLGYPEFLHFFRHFVPASDPIWKQRAIARSLKSKACSSDFLGIYS